MDYCYITLGMIGSAVAMNYTNDEDMEPDSTAWLVWQPEALSFQVPELDASSYRTSLQNPKGYVLTKGIGVWPSVGSLLCELQMQDEYDRPYAVTTTISLYPEWFTCL